MKKVLIQLDSDKFASVFDCIVAHDAGADVVQSYSGVTRSDVRNLILGAFFTRGIQDLKSLAVWIGGSDVGEGEQILEEARRTFFGPFKVSLMLDSNGCNTTASTAIVKLARRADLRRKTVLVIGPGPVGVRSAALLAREGSLVRLTSIPSEVLGSSYDSGLAYRTLESGREAAASFRTSPLAAAGGSIEAEAVPDLAALKAILNEVEIMVAAGPAGLQMIPRDIWAASPSLKWLLDFNLTEPFGIQGIRPGDDFAEYNGKRALGALAIGNPKMQVHKACIARLFERNDLVLDIEGVFGIAGELIF